jgi:hypothetical protein
MVTAAILISVRYTLISVKMAQAALMVALVISSKLAKKTMR